MLHAITVGWASGRREWLPREDVGSEIEEGLGFQRRVLSWAGKVYFPREN